MNGPLRVFFRQFEAASASTNDSLVTWFRPYRFLQIWISVFYHSDGFVCIYTINARLFPGVDLQCTIYTVINISYDVIVCASAVTTMARVNFENAFTLSRGWSIKSVTSANKKSEEEVNSMHIYSCACHVKAEK